VELSDISNEQAAIPNGCSFWFDRAAMDKAAECASARWLTPNPRATDNFCGVKCLFIAPIMVRENFKWV
jgi:hypothetical protein